MIDLSKTTIAAAATALVFSGTVALVTPVHAGVGEAEVQIAQTQGMDRRDDRQDDRQGARDGRQDNRGDKRDTRQDCRQAEGAGADKRECKQEGGASTDG